MFKKSCSLSGACALKFAVAPTVLHPEALAASFAHAGLGVCYSQ